MKTVYWTSSLIIAGFLLMSAYTYFFSKANIEGLRALGFPDFFRIQLGILKLLAIPILLIPSIPIFIKEWGYAGIGLFLITAMVAHIAHNDSPSLLVLLIILFGLLVMSRYSMGVVIK